MRLVDIDAFPDQSSHKQAILDILIDWLVSFCAGDQFDLHSSVHRWINLFSTLYECLLKRFDGVVVRLNDENLAFGLSDVPKHFLLDFESVRLV